MRYRGKHVKKRKLKYKNIFLLIGIIFVLSLGIGYMFHLPISNIYIINNQYLTDQEIMEYAEISNYPKSYTVFPFSVKKKLNQNLLIKNVKVTKKLFTQIYIEVQENRPLFYYENKTILLDGSFYDREFNVPYVLNYIPDTVSESFHYNMTLISEEVLDRISEIKYDPNDVDEERFLFVMKDQNYVYVTLSKFTSVNNYLDIVKKFENKKGIFYLDSGEYFEVLKG